MSVRSGQSLTVEFTTRRADTGGAANADSLPTGTLIVNGTDNAATVTVTNVATGRYKGAVTLPTLAADDMVELLISAVVNSVSDSSVIFRDSSDLAVVTSGIAALQALLISGTTSVSQQSPQPLRVARFEAPTITVTMLPAQSVSGWSMNFTIRQNGVSLFTTTTATIIDAGNGVFTFALTSTQTGALAVGMYDFDVWRTDTGYETQLAYGRLEVTREQWK